MNMAFNTLKRLEFEARIFVSLGIVAFACVLSFFVVADSPPVVIQFNHFINIAPKSLLTFAYALGAFAMLLASLLRMWAGSVLTPTRVMAFTVQADALKTSGPYRIVRNPIYLADFIAICVFALYLPPVGLLMPGLFFFHYQRLISFEEESLAGSFTKSFQEYLSNTPRLFPSFRSISHVPESVKEFRISSEGFRHNALFVLFIAGFIVAAITHEFIHAVLIGIPGVIDWAIIHTKIGLNK
jgi:protein-S-isoprenylcysteine O-methyltransferase Ste14